MVRELTVPPVQHLCARTLLPTMSAFCGNGRQGLRDRNAAQSSRSSAAATATNEPGAGVRDTCCDRSRFEGIATRSCEPTMIDRQLFGQRHAWRSSFRDVDSANPGSELWKLGRPADVSEFDTAPGQRDRSRPTP